MKVVAVKGCSGVIMLTLAAATLVTFSTQIEVNPLTPVQVTAILLPMGQTGTEQ